MDAPVPVKEILNYKDTYTMRIQYELGPILLTWINLNPSMDK